MRQKAVILSFTLAVVVGVSAYAFYSFSKEALRRSPDVSQVPPPPGPVLHVPAPGGQGDLPAPPPARGGKPAPPLPEPRRTLVGTTQGRLRQIEQSLPAGSRVYLGSVADDKSMAALAEADLDGDGAVESVVVYKQPAADQRGVTQSLVLGVLVRKGGGLSVRTSVPLEGGVLFNIRVDGTDLPLAVRDLTGDGRPEIIVASGIGASIGGEIQVFKVEGTALKRTLNVGGHIFQVHKRPGQPSVVTARSRYRPEAVSYRWDGQRFVQLAGG